MSTTVRVVVTGATGQVAYALLPRIASGEMFGPDTEIDLRLADIPQMIDKAKGVLMELEDGAYPLLETKAGARVRDVKKLAIWGNHSATLFPDFTNAEVKGKSADEVVDRKWLENEFIPQVQQRGAAVIAARGASSAFSAGQALVD